MSVLGGPELEQSEASHILSRQGLGKDRSEKQKQESDRVFYSCVALHAVPREQQCDYYVANVAFSASQNLRKRIIGAGLDIKPVDDLVPLLIADPEFALGKHVLEQPALFGKPMLDVARESDVELSKLVWWILEYVAARWSQITAGAAASGPETVCASR
jgi:hypothetical protein